MATLGMISNSQITDSQVARYPACGPQVWIILLLNAAGLGTRRVRYRLRIHHSTISAGGGAIRCLTACDKKHPRLRQQPTSRERSADGQRHFRLRISRSPSLPAGCAWSASSDAPFISVVGASAGNGNGSVRFRRRIQALRQLIRREHGTVNQDPLRPAFSVSPDRPSLRAEAELTLDVSLGGENFWTAATGLLSSPQRKARQERPWTGSPCD